jgi:2-polyprenyl-3-methyl-5-hydroxy-6-metoxy-1,4-benzoquinol methylase
MTFIDRILQSWRIAKAVPFIKPQARVLDIGCADGRLFKEVEWISRESIGIDPTLKTDTRIDGVRIVAGYFPKSMPPAEPFDAITMLAVLEHFPASSYSDLASGCARFLKPNGRLIITVPSPMVDHVLKVLKFLRLIDGMSLEEHHGFEVHQTTAIFPAKDFRLVKRKRFQLGLNNLFVFERN